MSILCFFVFKETGIVTTILIFLLFLENGLHTDWIDDIHKLEEQSHRKVVELFIFQNEHIMPRLIKIMKKFKDD